MSRARGRETFEGPSEQELENYIKKGRQSLKRMEGGKSPLFFKPKKSYPKILPLVIISIVVVSSIFITISLLSTNGKNLNNATQQQIRINSPTSSTYETEIVNISLSGKVDHYWYYIESVDDRNHTWTTNVIRNLPDGIYTLHAYGNDTTGLEFHDFITFTIFTQSVEPEEIQDLAMSINQLENSIDVLIGSNHSTINTIFDRNTENASKVINFTEILDLIWILSQFEEYSEQWNLGRQLLFEDFPFWNSTSIDLENFPIQLKALRSLLSYSESEILLNSVNFDIFRNKSEYLWNQTILRWDIQSNVIKESLNDSFSLGSLQILFLEIIAKAVSHPSVFNSMELQGYANNILETIDQLTNITKGFPNQFSTNFSSISQTYYCQQQGELFIAVEYASNALAVKSTSLRIKERLIGFINGFLSSGEGTYFSSYDTKSHEHSGDVKIIDQSLISRCNIILKYPTSTSNAIEALIATLSDLSTLYLIDQVQSLLAFRQYIVYESSIASATYPHAGASFWGIEIFFLSMIVITVNKVIQRRKKKIEK